MDRICTCGHKREDHRVYKAVAHNKRSKKIMQSDGTLMNGEGAMVSANFKASGCTVCNCIAFRLEEARLLR
jgi:hypothetical protein